MDVQKQWPQRQQQLRQLLRTKQGFHEALKLFRLQHAAVHAAALVQARIWSFEDEIVTGLTDEQLRLRPTHLPSIDWLLWHAARTEDVTINLLVAGGSQVLTDEDWLDRLHLMRRDTGTGMNDEEVTDFSAHVVVPAVRAYRLAVGQRTQAIIERLTVADVQAPIDAAGLQALIIEGALADAAAELGPFWATKPKGFFLTRTATSHNFLHLQQAQRVRCNLIHH